MSTNYVTLPEVRAESSPIARLLHAYGLLENALKAIDGVESFASFGDRIQGQESILGLDLLKRVNFALGVRNSVAHGQRRTDEEIGAAADYFLKAFARHVSQLSDSAKTGLLGTDYRPPTPPKPPKRRRNGELKYRRRLKAVEGIEVGGVRVLPFLYKLSECPKLIQQELEALQQAGFEVGTLRLAAWNPHCHRQIKSVRVSLTRAVTRRTKKPRRDAFRAYHLALCPVTPLTRELQAITDAFLRKAGWQPVMGTQLVNEVSSHTAGHTPTEPVPTMQVSSVGVFGHRRIALLVLLGAVLSWFVGKIALQLIFGD